MEKQWNVLPLDSSLCQSLGLSLNIPPIMAQLLINRGLTDVQQADHFLNAGVHDLHDPFLLKGMTAAIERIRLARQQQEKVMVFGDYDVDGVTSSVILNQALTKLGLNVVHHIPHRMHDGYGLNKKIAGVIQEQGVSVLIAVDCGTTAFEEVAHFQAMGVDVIILDHHQPEEVLPEALALINPKQPGCAYPFKHLASAGLAAKLAQALWGKLDAQMLDFAAIGTVADVVPLHGENRAFVKRGLPKLHQTTNKGLNALLDIAKIRGKLLKPFHIGFVLGPRINAAGRMDSAQISLELFLTNCEQEARGLASTLDAHNLKRQQHQREVVAEAIRIVDEDAAYKDHKVIVLGREGWHKGVVGIVASRIAEKYNRPSIIISLKDGVGTASARSVNGFHLYNALVDCSDYLEAFGGHKAAAGLTIKEVNIPLLQNKLNAVAGQSFSQEDQGPTLRIDAEIPLGLIDLDLAQRMDDMEPFGEGNPTPTFCTCGLKVQGQVMVLGRGTLKFTVTDGQYRLSVVGFGMQECHEMVASGQPLDLAYEIIIDDWNKAPTPQLKLKDVKLGKGC